MSTFDQDPPLQCDSDKMAAELDADQLSAAHIQSLPGAMYYIPNFISPNEEEQILSKVYRSPVPVNGASANAFTAPSQPLDRTLPSPVAGAPFHSHGKQYTSCCAAPTLSDHVSGSYRCAL